MPLFFPMCDFADSVRGVICGTLIKIKSPAQEFTMAERDDDPVYFPLIQYFLQDTNHSNCINHKRVKGTLGIGLR